jgi:hypothetical protein
VIKRCDAMGVPMVFENPLARKMVNDISWARLQLDLLLSIWHRLGCSDSIERIGARKIVFCARYVWPWETNQRTKSRHVLQYKLGDFLMTWLCKAPLRATKRTALKVGHTFESTLPHNQHFLVLLSELNFQFRMSNAGGTGSGSSSNDPEYFSLIEEKTSIVSVPLEQARTSKYHRRRLFGLGNGGWNVIRSM